MCVEKLREMNSKEQAILLNNMRSQLFCTELWFNLEKAMAPHSSTLAWNIPWTEEPGRLQSMGSLRIDTTEWLPFHFSLSCIGEGNGNHSSVLAWRIPGMGEPGRLLSMGSHRVGHDWIELAAAAIRFSSTWVCPERQLWCLFWEF